MDDEFDLHANLDSEPSVIDVATTPTSFYKSTIFKVLAAVLIVIVIVFVVSYFWGSKTASINAPPMPIPIPMPTHPSIPKTEHEKLAKTIPKNELYEVMKASDNAQLEKRKGLLNEFKPIQSLNINNTMPDKAAIILSAKGIYEKLSNESTYIPSKNDVQVLQYCMNMTAPAPKTVTINPTLDISQCADESKCTVDDEDDDSIIEIGKKSPLDDLDQ